MSELQQPHQRRDLSEISYLFLSSVRDRQTGAAPRPIRKPPIVQRQISDAEPHFDPHPPVPAVHPQVSVDMTPHEFEQMCRGNLPEPSTDSDLHRTPILAVLASHLGQSCFDQVKTYARCMASDNRRIGLIELTASSLRLWCIESSLGSQEPASSEPPQQVSQPQQISQALDELNWDVQQWLLFIHEAQPQQMDALLKQIDHWTILTSADHDSIVASYRALKGLQSHRPQSLTVAVLGCQTPAEADRVSARLAAVTEQFLRWTPTRTQFIPADSAASDYPVLTYDDAPAHPHNPDAAPANLPPHWQVVSSFLHAATDETSPVTQDAPDPLPLHSHTAQAASAEPSTLHPFTDPTPAAQAESPFHQPIRLAANTNSVDTDHPAPSPHPTRTVFADVIDLPDADTSLTGLLPAIINHPSSDLTACDIPLPEKMTASARLAVDTQGGLIMLAALQNGLTSLDHAAHAYQWLIDNRRLIALAAGRLGIDCDIPPQLRLYIDWATQPSQSSSQSLLHASGVSLHCYRLLTWHGRTGILLDAA